MTDVELFRAAATAAYGREFHGKLAEELAVGLRTVQRWGTGAMPIPPGLWAEMHTLMVEQITKLNALATWVAARAPTDA
jgi:hypothetical protein